MSSKNSTTIKANKGAVQVARTNLEWDIYWILISYLDAEEMSDDIAHDIMQLLKGKLLKFEE